MVRRVVSRLWLVILLFGLAFGVLVPWRHASTEGLGSTPPTPVVVREAKALSNGVHLSWIEAQPGSAKISGYSIERSRGKQPFEKIVRTEAVSRTYLDTDGKAGDRYRIVTEDVARKASQPSPVYTAVAPEPGDNVEQSNEIYTKAPLDPAQTPAQHAALLATHIQEAYKATDAAIAIKGPVVPKLRQIQTYQNQALTLAPKLSVADKTLLAQACGGHQGMFHTNTYTLSESERKEAVLVIAGCEALRGLL